MAPALNLNVEGTAFAEQSEKWLTFKQVDQSSLDGTLKYVYHTQLQELRSILESSSDRTVQQFVAVEEMQALTTAFRRAVARFEREQEEKRAVKASSKASNSQAATMWKSFRRMDLK